MQQGSKATILHDPVKAALSFGFLVVFALSLVKPPYPEFLLLQHIPTTLALILIPIWDRRWPMGRGSLACLVGILVLHLIGARYIYSFVPYDAWLQASAGIRPTELFELTRNHYDRVVHLLFGVLLIWPLREFFQVHRAYSRGSAIVTAVLVVMSASMIYEVVEWIVAITFSPGDAEAYNGQQGDHWDAQKDMALALGGALLAGCIQLGIRPLSRR